MYLPHGVFSLFDFMGKTKLLPTGALLDVIQEAV